MRVHELTIKVRVELPDHVNPESSSVAQVVLRTIAPRRLYAAGGAIVKAEVVEHSVFQKGGKFDG